MWPPSSGTRDKAQPLASADETRGPLELGSPSHDAGHPQLSSASRTLADTNALAAQTIDVGAGILTELGTQRETLQGARDTHMDMREALRSSNALIRKMLRRAAANKLLKQMTIVLLLIAIFTLIFVKWGAGEPPS